MPPKAFFYTSDECTFNRWEIHVQHFCKAHPARAREFGHVPMVLQIVNDTLFNVQQWVPAILLLPICRRTAGAGTIKCESTKCSVLKMQIKGLLWSMRGVYDVQRLWILLCDVKHVISVEF